MKPTKAVLALEDGRFFHGYSLTGQGEAWGEIVFNTSMTGYQEVLTDPSYAGQIVAMTYPHIGNCGVNDQDVESAAIRVEGFILREYHPVPSNWRSQRNLADYLSSAGKLGLTGIDTRALTRHLRERGAMMGYMSTRDLDPDSVIEKAHRVPNLIGRDLVQGVTTAKPYLWAPDPEGGRPEYDPETLEAWP
ncbi:MAG: carbamoyl-phosphate synthase domain-containing protein, partial [Pseudomonadota bacterium]